jgi:hypothetical protein
MRLRTPLLGAAALLTAALGAGSAYAYSEGEIARFHQLCQAGDHAACARRDTVIHDRDHQAEWRHSHPDWYR